MGVAGGFLFHFYIKIVKSKMDLVGGGPKWDLVMHLWMRLTGPGFS